MEAKLKPKPRLFCEYYVSHQETHGNGVQSYALAYGYGPILPSSDDYDSVKANANRLLNKTEIKSYISQLLQEQVLDRDIVSIEFGYLIKQNKNLSVKRQAIADYYRLVPQKNIDPVQRKPLGSTEMDYEQKLLAACSYAYERDRGNRSTVSDALDVVEDVYNMVEDFKKGSYQLPPDLKEQYKL